MARWSSVELEEQCLPGHLRVAGETAATAEHEQILERQRPFAVVGKRERGVVVARGANAEHFVERCECGVDHGCRVPCGEHEPVRVREPWPADIPAHGA